MFTLKLRNDWQDKANEKIGFWDVGKKRYVDAIRMPKRQQKELLQLISKCSVVNVTDEYVEYQYEGEKVRE